MIISLLYYNYRYQSAILRFMRNFLLVRDYEFLPSWPTQLDLNNSDAFANCLGMNVGPVLCWAEMRATQVE